MLCQEVSNSRKVKELYLLRNGVSVATVRSERWSRGELRVDSRSVGDLEGVAVPPLCQDQLRDFVARISLEEQQNAGFTNKKEKEANIRVLINRK